MMGLGKLKLHVSWDLMISFGKPQLYAKFEVAGLIYYGNIREFVFYTTNSLSDPPFTADALIHRNRLC